MPNAAPRTHAWPSPGRTVSSMGLWFGLWTGLCLAALAAPAGAQPRTLGQDPEQLEIKLVTFGVGQEVHQYFGHNAIWVRDRQARYSKLYNYGMFSFGPDMLANYMQGRLTFWVAATPVQRTFAAYRRMDRDIIVQDLNLDPAARKRIVDRVVHDALPENRSYLYHHYYDNCSTRLRDVIDEAVGGQLKAHWSAPARFNYREHTRRYAERQPVVNLALLFWMNDAMEEPIQRWHEAFLPLELSEGLSAFHYTNAAGDRVPLVSRTYALYEGMQPAVPAAPSPTWIPVLLIGLLTGGLACVIGLARRRKDGTGLRIGDGVFHALLGLVFGFPALLGFLMATLTEHKVTWWNENQLLANPLTFLLLPLGILLAFGVRWADRLARVCAYLLGLGAVLSLALKVLPAFDQDNWIPMALLLPLNLGLAAAHWLRAHAPGAAAQPAGGSPAVEAPLSGERSGA